MLFPHKSFCFFEINDWPLLPRNFTILTQKIKPVEEWKIRGFIVNIIGWYSRYLEDYLSVSFWNERNAFLWQIFSLVFFPHLSVSFWNERNAFLWQIFLLFWDKWLAIAPKKFHHFNSKNKTSGRVERYRCLLSILYGPMVTYTPVCIYNHEEFFCNI